MKLKSFIVASILVLSSSAFAQWFPGRVHMAVYTQQVSAQVMNPYYEPIICSGYVFGQSYGGYVINAFFNEQYLTPGEYRYAYVQASPYAPFVNGWANINCRFARFW